MYEAKSIATGDFGFFIQAGLDYTVPSAGVVSATSKPGALDPLWCNIGNIEKCSISINGEKEEEIWGPTGQSGVISLRDIITTKQNLEFKLTCNEMTPLAIQAFYRTLRLTTASDHFIPLSAPPPKGWLKIQRFDQDSLAHLVMDVYCRLKVTGGMDGGDGSALKPEFTATVLYSIYNQAVI